METGKETAPKVQPLYASNGKHGSKATTGTYVALDGYACNMVTFFTEDVAVRVVQRALNADKKSNEADDTNTEYVTVPANQSASFAGLKNANELWVASADSSSITVRYRMEW